MDFLQIVHPNQGATVFGQRVRRARFGNHIRLNKLAYQIDQLLRLKQSRQAAIAMAEYFEFAGFNAVGLERESLLIAYGQLVALNQLKYLLPFQAWQGPPPGEPKPYDYEARYIAWLVHKLASRYGWTRDYIFSLWPEEVFAYVQEILVSEYQEIDQKRSLSELGYHYDKTTGRAVFRPMPMPGWMVGEPEKKTYRIKKSMLPVGFVVRLGEQDENIIH